MLKVGNYLAVVRDEFFVVEAVIGSETSKVVELAAKHNLIFVHSEEVDRWGLFGSAIGYDLYFKRGK